MSPIESILARADRGFTLGQKIGLTVAWLCYLAVPLDLCIDAVPVLGWSDDAFLGYVLLRVWKSPTLGRHPS